MTAAQIREKIIAAVSENGGHLASSLGAVEISMALAKVFEPQRDRIIWDVGHQAYAWKILTGRDISSLRKLGGVSPFPNPNENAADAAVAGHAGVALSVALGMAAARDRMGRNENVVAVIGDGAIVNGTSFEALNNCSMATNKVIVVLNDNEMSISRPTGSFAKLLGKLITGVRYNRIKAATEAAGHKLKLTPLRGIYHKIESSIKSWFVGNRFFEQFGLRYIGPIDGHNLKALESAFVVAKEDKRSVIVHVVTKKGKGFPPAEKDPTAWHGVSRFSIDDPRLEERKRDWSASFGEALVAAARADKRIVAITAGMRDGTGLGEFAKEFPDRFFDVGIAEGHMVAFAAGLAAAGMRPVVAVYSTFMQRAADQIMHDVAIAGLPVVFCVDRAGVVGADGMTHQGVFDIAWMRSLPNMTLCQPKDDDDLNALLKEALARNGPTIIRYPRGAVPASDGCRCDGALSAQLCRADAKTQIWAAGDQVAKARAVADRTGAGVVFARYLKPFDSNLLAAQRAAGMRIVTLENGALAGGFGEAIGADLKFGWPDEFVPHGTLSELEEKYRFDEASIMEAING